MKIACLFLFAFASQAYATLLTPLTTDKHPCKPEYIKNQVRYLCKANGEVQCQNGWDMSNDKDELFPCITPVCNPACANGNCVAPNKCACEIGWEGPTCSTCIALPGCHKGSCKNKGLNCECDKGWSGGLCNIPVCDVECKHGTCTDPNTCKCDPGWKDSDDGTKKCDTCIPLKGCDTNGGTCIDATDDNKHVPNACFCKTGYKGHLCDKPDCTSKADCNEATGKGTCVIGTKKKKPVCKCNPGWMGDDCASCIIAHGCPASATCTKPGQCDCTALANTDKTDICD